MCQKVDRLLNEYSVLASRYDTLEHERQSKRDEIFNALTNMQIAKYNNTEWIVTKIEESEISTLKKDDLIEALKQERLPYEQMMRIIRNAVNIINKDPHVVIRRIRQDQNDNEQ